MDYGAILQSHGTAHRPGGTPQRPDVAVDKSDWATDAGSRLSFAELYATTGIIGLRLSEKAQDLHGSSVIIRGYMAPPMEETSDFFVLTRNPVAACPFCDTRASWPDDIVPTLLRRESGLLEPFQ